MNESPSSDVRIRAPAYCFTLSFFNALDRESHRRAAEQQKKRVERCERQSHQFRRRSAEIRTADAQNNIGADERTEQHHFGRKKCPHAQAAAGNSGGVVFESLFHKLGLPAEVGGLILRRPIFGGAFNAIFIGAAINVRKRGKVAMWRR